MLKRTKHTMKRRRMPVNTLSMLRVLAVSEDRGTRREARQVIRAGAPYRKSYGNVGLLLRAVIEGDYKCALARSNWENFQALKSLQ